MQAELEAIFEITKEFYKKVEAETLIRTALSFKFSKKLVEKLEKEYYEKPDPELIDLC